MGTSSLAECDVVILCGGRGTRLGALTTTTPKPLLPVGGKTPFLVRRMLALRQEGVTRIILSTHVFSEQFDALQREYRDGLPQIHIVREPEPLGTGGGLRFALSAVQTPYCLAMNGDSWVEQPLTPVLEAHHQHGRAFTMTVVDAAQVEGNSRQKGLVRVGAQREVLGFSTGDATSGWVNAGLYAITTSRLAQWPTTAYDLERQFLRLVPPSQSYAFPCAGRLIDIGTPDVYARGAELLTTLPA